jgi:hypothetical protein
MNVALKEWSAVIAALDGGLQIFLLRKGGIVESKRGFELRHREFLLFPTFEHQHAQSLKPEYRDLLTGAAESTESIRISHVARVAEVLEAPESLAGMESIYDRHVWNRDFLRMRYAYRPDLPLYMILVRVRRLDTVRIIPRRPAYAGCKSWVNLTAEIAVEAGDSVLAEAEFDRRRKDLTSRLGRGRELLENGEQTPE